MTIQKKLVTVGSTNAKMYLFGTFEVGVFIPDIHKPCDENYPSELYVQIDGEIIELKIFNACYRPEYERLRPLSYHNSDVILACFAIDNHSSLYFLIEKFRAEAKCYCPDTPVIVVGIKSDLRSEIGREKQGLVSVEEAYTVARKLGAVCYIECSPKLNYNVEMVFVKAARAALRKYPKKKTRKVCVFI